MSKERLEAFSDGVIAIIITIMVLELGAPKQASWQALWQQLPSIFSYLFSFTLVGTYWINHHHLFEVTQTIDNRVLWANLLFLLLLSLFPACTQWIAVSAFAQVPMISYIVVMLMTTLSYILVHHTIVLASSDCRFKELLKIGRKERISVLLETVALIFSWIGPLRWFSILFLIGLTPVWLIPDMRIRTYRKHKGEKDEL